MLHSSLPRAFLAPGFNYLGYYPGDEVHQHHPHHHHHPPPYGATASWHIPMESASAYSRVPEPRVLHTWDLSRSSTPCPLDLSLKASAATSAANAASARSTPSTPSTPKIEEDCSARLDAKKDRVVLDEETRIGEAIGYRGRGTDDETGSVIVDDYEAGPRRSSSVPSGHSGYERLPSRPAEQKPGQVRETPEKTCLPDEAARMAPFATVTDIVASKYYDQKQLLLASPSQLQSVQSCYHQQLLLTPQHHLQAIQHAPMTPPSTPSPPQCPRRKAREEEEGSPASTGNNVGARSASTDNKLVQRPKKKHARRLKFDEDTSSPVSGTVILGPDEAVVTGDIDPAFNIVEVTEEARAELAKIENRLGPYQCKLCRQLHDDAFQLAQHRCSRIAHVEYRCPECDKRFSCPANLASHRRWHKPRLASGEPAATAATIEIPCTRCDAKFTRQAALRKHLASQHPEASNNGHAVLDGQRATVGGKVDVVQALSDSGSSSTEMP